MEMVQVLEQVLVRLSQLKLVVVQSKDLVYLLERIQFYIVVVLDIHLELLIWVLIIFSQMLLTSSSTLGSGTGGSITIIISPKGGHGSNAVTELGGHYVMTNTTLTQAENDDITTANDFREVGLVVDSTTYGTSTVASASTGRMTYIVKMSTSSGTFDVDETITQATTGAVGRVVEWDSSRSLLYYQQERFGSYGTNSTTGALRCFFWNTNHNWWNFWRNWNTIKYNRNCNTCKLKYCDTNNWVCKSRVTFDSGNIVYLENRKPIQRNSDQTEDIKIIIEF